MPNKMVPNKISKHIRLLSEPASSLIERVMFNDFCKFDKETNQTNQLISMNFDRIQTFIKDKLYFQGPELIQRDI